LILMPSSLASSWNSPEVKLVPLSVMMLLGTPYRQVMDSKNLTTVVASWLVTGISSIHLENLSMATKR
jgi:hypothetical protein